MEPSYPRNPQILSEDLGMNGQDITARAFTSSRLVFRTLPHCSLSSFTRAQGLTESKYLLPKRASSMTALMPFLKSQWERHSLYSSRAFAISSWTSLAASDWSGSGIVPKFFLVKLRHLW